MSLRSYSEKKYKKDILVNRRKSQWQAVTRPILSPSELVYKALSLPPLFLKKQRFHISSKPCFPLTFCHFLTISLQSHRPHHLHSKHFVKNLIIPSLLIRRSNFPSNQTTPSKFSSNLSLTVAPRSSFSSTMMSLRASSFLAPSDFLSQRCSVPKPQFFPLPSIQNSQQSESTNSISLNKPLYISSTKNLTLVQKKEKLLTECKAYEADRSRPLEINIDLPDDQARLEAAQRLKIGLYFATWWALNVVFNIYNKKVLNAFPYPWLTSTLSLAAGSLMMLLSWATRLADAPKTDLDFWKSLFPVRTSTILFRSYTLLCFNVEKVN